MNENINLAEILKNCPSGMELDCALYHDVYFDYIDKCNIIRCYIQHETHKEPLIFNHYGTHISHTKSKCVIFPKGKTTWKGFVPPCMFNAGDVLVSEHGNIVLFSHIDSKDVVHYHCIMSTYKSFKIEENTNIGVGRYYNCVLANEQQRQKMYDKIKCSGYKYNQSINKLEKINSKFEDGDIVATYDGKYIAIIKNNDGKYYVCCHLNSNYFHIDQSGWFDRLATEEEKQKLFQAIKDNGYKWIAKTKTLEKLITPKFKVGDIIQDKDSYKVKIIAVNTDQFYEYESLIAKEIGGFLFEEQDDWELVPNKFDISTLKPFDKVLVRDSQRDYWRADLFSHIGNNEIYPYITSCTKFKYCIPYNSETKHLVGTTLEEPKFYKNW